MRQAGHLQWYARISVVWPSLVLLLLAAIPSSVLHAQDAPQGPLVPPPEHHVTRIGNVSEPEAPPSLPEAEIIKRFSLKEDEYVLERARYSYRKTIRIQEFGPDGQPSGGVSADFKPACEIRPEVPGQGASRRGRLLHLSGKTSRGRARQGLFRRHRLGGHEISGGSENVWEMGY